MARPHRIEFPGAFFHVYARGNNKQKIFLDEQDYSVYLDRVERYYNRYKFILYAYVLMSNHVHFAIEMCEIPLSKIMQGIQQSYSYYARKKYGLVGHLYQGPYCAVLYDKEEFSLDLVQYIHRNPVEANLIDNPLHYPWGSHPIYMNNEKHSFLNKTYILNMFPFDKAKARRKFHEYVLEGPQSLEQLNFEKVRDRQIIGNKKYIKYVNKKNRSSSNDQTVNLKLKDFTLSKQKTLTEILKIISKQTKVSAESILSQCRLQDFVKARRMFAFISAKYGGYGTVEISEFLKKNSSSVSYMIHKFEKELAEDPILSEELKKVIHVFEARPQS